MPKEIYDPPIFKIKNVSISNNPVIIECSESTDWEVIEDKVD